MIRRIRSVALNANRPPSRIPWPTGVRGGGGHGQNRCAWRSMLMYLVGVPSAIQRHREERAVAGEGCVRKLPTV